MRENTPIIFFDNRKELSTYFLRILHSMSARNPVVILVAEEGLHPPRGRENVSIVNIYTLPGYQQIELEFFKRYIHLSTHSYEFETSCFLRFFALECFLKNTEFDRAWLLDCDAWPTESLGLYESSNSEYFSPGILNRRVVSCHSSLISLDLVEDFTRYLLNDFYLTKTNELSSLFEERQRKGLTGGICDMTAMGMFLNNQYHRPWLDTNFHGQSEHFINHSMETLYQELGKSKNSIVLVLRIRHCFMVISGRTVRRYSILHFQGNNKHLIPIIQKFRFLLGNLAIFSILVRISRKYQKVFLS